MGAFFCIECLGMDSRIQFSKFDEVNGRDDGEQYKECFLFAMEVFDYFVLLIDQLASSRNHLVLTGRFGDIH